MGKKPEMLQSVCKFIHITCVFYGDSYFVRVNGCFDYLNA